MNGPTKKKNADANDAKRAGQRLDSSRAVPIRVVKEGETKAPVPLPEVDALPPFPLHVFPPVLQRFVGELAEEVQAPADMPAMLVLACLSLVSAKKFLAQVRSGWTEVLALYVLVAAESGSLKSVVFKRVLAPVLELETSQRAEAYPLRQVELSTQRILQGRVRKLEKSAAEGKTAELRAEAERELKEVRTQLDALRVRPLPRRVTGDVTLEKLGDMLVDQGGRLGLFAPESQKLLTILAGRYSAGRASDTADCDVLLNSHSGDDYVVDRVNKGEQRVSRPTLTLGLMAQPKRLEKLCKIDDGSGLTARFAFCVLPPRDPLAVNLEPAAMNEGTLERYSLLIQKLDTIKAQTNAAGVLVERAVFFDDAAWRAVVDYRQKLASRLARGGDLAQDPRLKEWGLKAHGLLARLALLLHLAWNANEPDPAGKRVGAEVVGYAAELVDYLALHAMRAFDVARVDEPLANARLIWEWLEEKKLGQFDERDLQRNATPKHLRHKDTLRPALERLWDRGLIHCTDERPERTVNRSFIVRRPVETGRQAGSGPQGAATAQKGPQGQREPAQPVSEPGSDGRQTEPVARNGATDKTGAGYPPEAVNATSEILSPLSPQFSGGGNTKGSEGGAR